MSIQFVAPLLEMSVDLNIPVAFFIFPLQAKGKLSSYVPAAGYGFHLQFVRSLSKHETIDGKSAGFPFCRYCCIQGLLRHKTSEKLQMLYHE